MASCRNHYWHFMPTCWFWVSSILEPPVARGGGGGGGGALHLDSAWSHQPRQTVAEAGSGDEQSQGNREQHASHPLDSQCRRLETFGSHELKLPHTSFGSE